MKAAIHIKWHSLQSKHVLFLKTEVSWDVMPHVTVWAVLNILKNHSAFIVRAKPTARNQGHSIISHFQQHCHQNLIYSISHLCFTLDCRNCHRNSLMFGNSTTCCWFTVTVWFWLHLKPIHSQTHSSVSHTAPANTTLLSSSVKQHHSSMHMPLYLWCKEKFKCFLEIDQYRKYS